MQRRTGLLLLNLGTPDSPSVADVRRYLHEFLSDPRVLDINPVGRALLLNLIILRTRPPKSAHAYAAIWDAQRGSPLLFHTQDLAAGVQAKLGNKWLVDIGMRYGEPSIASALAKFRDQAVDDIVVLPLYPQLASSSTGTAVEKVLEVVSARWNTPALAIVPPFYDDPGFIAAFAAQGRAAMAANPTDHVLFSFHGLPERHVHKADDSGSHCLRQANCCATITATNRNCYRAQCYATARALAASLELADDKWSVAFQSRLGKTPWIQPFFDDELKALRNRGVARVAVMCPAFVADCLETLEEIGIRAKADWLAMGGEALHLVASLNATAPWVDAVVALAERYAPATP